MSYSVENYSDEKEFKISLFDYKNRQKFEKFTAFAGTEGVESNIDHSQSFTVSI